MNEVHKIHLGRQAYTISVDAQHELRSYIDAINNQVKDAEVINEVEVRMSELLTERGVTASKVILPKDVDYLKSQLGSPADFGDEDSEEQDSPSETKKLFRDTDHAIVAGVAAGLSRYFGIDTLLIRIIFVIIILATVGWGILLYILLWLLIPEAKSPSEKLQMEGRRVNVQGLKEIVDKADVKGAARRVNRSIAGPINTLFNLALKVVGIAFVAFGLAGILGLITGETYFLAQGKAWSQNNIFPIGIREHVLFYFALGVVALITVFIVLFGIAIFRRKWPIKVWVTGVMIGVVFIGMAVSGALIADAYPSIHSAYNKNTHTTNRTVKSFSTLEVSNDFNDNLNFVTSNKYMVSFNYYAHPNLSTIKTTVNKGTLLIDTSNFDPNRNCSTLCIPKTYELNVTIYAPNAYQLENENIPSPPMPEGPKLFNQ